jgi:large subunit ribosomal protein L7Ae
MVKKAKKSTIYTTSQIKKLNDKHPLSQPNKRSYRLGLHIQPKLVRARFVKYPRYVELQRKKRVLMRRLKVPPALAQFFTPLDKATTTDLFKILSKYAPETKTEKKDRLKGLAKKQIEEQRAKNQKPSVLKFGLNHVTYLVEQKKAKLVLIANDVDPIEMVVFLPTLCKTMGIPFAIVNNKSRLGQLVHQKSAAVVALTEFKDSAVKLENIAKICKETFNDAHLHWKKPEQGVKFQHKEERAKKLRIAEEVKKGTA